MAELAQYIDQFKVCSAVNFIRCDGADDRYGEFIRACRRSYYCRSSISRLGGVCAVDGICNTCMCVNNVTRLIEEFTDTRKVLLLGCKTAPEVSKLLSHIRCDFILACLGEILHKCKIFLRIAIAGFINKALQIAGNQNIHGR